MTRLPLRFSPRPVRTFCTRLRNSPFVRDVEHNGGWLAFGCALLLVLALLIGLLSSHYLVTWHGVYEIPTPPSCGDWCGGDAGLITSTDTP